MRPKVTEKRLASSKEREDREGQSKYKFEPLRLEVRYPETAILLLQCQEKPILLAAAAALDKFGGKAQQNLETLFDLEIVSNLIPLIEHEDLFTRRFAAKLLAEMTRIPFVRNYLLESNHYVSHFLNVLTNEKDTFMQEFSSLILAEITKDMYGVAQFLEQCHDTSFLFERIQSHDPDVKKNNIEIVYNVMQDPMGAEKIIKSKGFNLIPIYESFDSPYPEIQQLALNVIHDLVTRNKDDNLQNHFRQTKGLQALLRFLDNDEWSDLHHEALRILSLASDNLATVELLDGIGGIRQILKYIEDKSNSRLFSEAFNVIVRLSNSPPGRKALYSYGVIDYLVSALKDGTQSDINEIICHGIGMMTLYNPAAKELTGRNCIQSILGVLKNENSKWSTRQAALFALNQLLKYDFENCNNFLNIQGQNYLLSLMKEPLGKVPVEIQIAAVENLTTIARHPSLRNVIINTDTIDAVCTPFQSTCPSLNELKIACCNVLSILCIEKTGRDAFLKVQGPSRLYNLLCDVERIPIRNAAARLVQFLSVDPILASAFVAAKYLSYMLNNRTSARIVPAWDTCIETLFNAHLPVKFAFTGRLSLHDITQDGFYVLRRHICPFPVLDDIFRFKFCPLEPVYVVNCTQSRRSSSTENLFSKVTSEDSEKMRTDNGSDDASKGIFLSAENVSRWLDLKFGRLQCDPCLREYIELFKCKLAASERKDTDINNRSSEVINIRYVATRARMLAKFVARQMSGPDPTNKCIDHQLEIHLKEIKDHIETSVIPLGMLRVGSYLERALLFKVIADRICLPAALVRGEYGKAWIEIAVPQMEALEEDTSFNPYLDRSAPCPEVVRRNNSKWYTSRSTSAYEQEHDIRSTLDVKNENTTSSYPTTVFPTKLMQPNFIVDLMHVPGDLIPLGSERAKFYCEKQLVCKMTCCED